MIDHPFQLRTLKVANFKSIAQAEIEFQPLSVVIGTNSSGKSSLLQVVLALSQAVRSRPTGTDFPLNGAYARFGNFKETILFQHLRDQEHQDEDTGIVISATLRDRRDRQYILIEGDERPVSDEERINFDWTLRLVSDDSTGSGFAKLDSVLYRCYDSTEIGNETITFSYDLVGLTNIHKSHERRNHPVISDFHRRTAGILTSTSPGSSYQGRNEEEEETMSYDCDAVRLVGAIPEAVYQLRTLAEAVGEHWWKTTVRYSHLIGPDKRGVEYRNDLANEAEDLGSYLDIMVSSAVSAGSIISERIQERLAAGIRLFSIENEMHNFLYYQLNDAEDDFRQRLERGRKIVRFDDFMRALATELEHADWAQQVVFDDIDSIFDQRMFWHGESLRWFFDQKVKYLGPLREAPKVLYDPRLYDLDIGISGEFAAAVVYANSDKSVVPIRNNARQSRVPLLEAVNFWLLEFGLAEEAHLEDRGRLGIGLQIKPVGSKERIDLTSVGVGVSQILPVIVLCLLAEPGELIILEQPELHLHPSLQQDLGDFLLLCAKSGRQLLVETHSEHLVNRLRRRVADISGWAEDMVGLHFAEQEHGITTFRSAAIDPFGENDDYWPKGFFDVSASEAQRLITASLAKRHRAKA